MLAKRMLMAAAFLLLAAVAGNDSNTVLLLHCDGDIGNTGHAITINGTPILTETAQTGYDGSMAFDGSTDYVTIPYNADFGIGDSATQDLTIDMWVRHDVIQSSIYISIFEDSNNQWKLGYSTGGGGIWFGGKTSGSYVVEVAYTNALSTDTWYHVALCKVYDNPNTLWGIYVDGVQQAYLSDNDTFTANGNISIGAENGSSQFMDGYISDLRIIKSNIFSAAPNATPDDTITKPTAHHTSDSNTVLLLPLVGNEAVGSATTHDVTIANTGLVYAQEAQEAAWETSFQFDGTSGYITIPDNADWDITTDWTVDFWLKMDNHTGTETLICQYEDGSNNWELKHIDGTGLRFDVDSGASTVVTLSGGEITDTNWAHIALCKVGNLYGIYKGGTQVAYVSDADTDTFAGSIYIAAFGGPANYFDGYLDEIRIQKSNIFSASPNATPDDTITVPTAPYDTE